MKAQIDECFPRGGSKPSKTAVVNVQLPKQQNLFGVIDKSKPKLKPTKREREKSKGAAKKHVESERSTDKKTAAVSTSELSTNQIQDGMLLLGCVHKVKMLSLDMELPGRNFGEVLIKYVSNPFNAELNKRLQDENVEEFTRLESIFTPGQFMPTKVLSTSPKIMLSLNPSDVNSDFTHKNIRKDMRIWGAISEKLDHGYMVDVGVPNCRAVLTFDKIDDGKDYEIGQPFYSMVTKCENLESTIISLSTLEQDLEKKSTQTDVRLDYIIPGIQVDFLVETVEKNGLQGKFCNKFPGFVNELYLHETYDKLEQYQVNQTIKAYTMYTEATTKITHLTLRNLNSVEVPALSYGDQAMAQVLSKTPKGVVIEINGKYKGFVSNKRILEMFTENSELKSAVNKRYAPATNHRCRILNYNFFNKIYVCTFNMSEKKVLIKGGLKHGEVVKCTIKEVQDQGLLVKVGKVDAFVNNLHLSNILYSENIKKRFTVGKKITAKVWNLATKGIKLTLKPDLLNSDVHLMSYEDVSVNDQEYLGVVANRTMAGVLVIFYGNVRGWLPKQNIPQLQNKDGKVNDDADARPVFYDGQVIKCFVAKKESDQKLILSLEKNASKQRILKPGDIYRNAKVTEITDEGLKLLLLDRNAPVFLPKEHLAFGQLGDAILKTYNVGDKTSNLLCISLDNPPIVSIREYQEHNKQGFKIPIFKHLRENQLLRCSYSHEFNEMVYLSAPIKDYCKKLHITKHELYSHGLPTDFKFKPHQAVIAKISKLDIDKNKISIVTDLQSVFNFDYMYTINMLDSRLGYIDKLHDKLRKMNDPITNLAPGQKVECLINKIEANGVSVSILPGKQDGFVNIKHTAKKVKLNIGETVEGIILWVNYRQRCANVSLKREVFEKLNPTQDGSLDASLLQANLFGTVLIANNNFALAVLNNRGNKQIIYLPVKVHENDFFPDVEHYRSLINTKVKIVPCKINNGRILGFDKKTLKSLKRSQQNNAIEPMLHQRNPKRKRKAQNENTGSNNCKVPKIELKSDLESDEGIASAEEEINNKQVDDLECENVDNDESEANDNNMEIDDEDVKSDSSDSEEDDSQLVPILSGASNYFQTANIGSKEYASSSSDDDENEEKTLKKKKKLKSTERADAAKEEEARLRRIEHELADPESVPQNAEQFDRLLLGNPDNSEIWMRYIAFHIQATEFDKARTIAKRALEKISYTAVQDRLNVWLAYLNLENMYGTKESFDKLFEEAARCNDSLTIHLESIKMLAEMHKTNEMEEKIKKVRAKYKQDLKMWLNVGKVYYEHKRLVDARKLKDAALTTLSDKKTHIVLIVQFAIMEFNYGEQNQGEALFETILQADPKRVDVWCTYVDQLVKKDSIDIARNVLNRAVGQKLPYKKMRTLFKKFHNFENTYGDDNTQERIKSLLEEYTEK